MDDRLITQGLYLLIVEAWSMAKKKEKIIRVYNCAFERKTCIIFFFYMNVCALGNVLFFFLKLQPVSGCVGIYVYFILFLKSHLLFFTFTLFFCIFIFSLFIVFFFFFFSVVHDPKMMITPRVCVRDFLLLYIKTRSLLLRYKSNGRDIIRMCKRMSLS